MKGLIKKVYSRKLAVTAVAGTGVGLVGSELSWPMAAVACAYIFSQALCDTFGPIRSE